MGSLENKVTNVLLLASMTFWKASKGMSGSFSSLKNSLRAPVRTCTSSSWSRTSNLFWSTWKFQLLFQSPEDFAKNSHEVWFSALETNCQRLCRFRRSSYVQGCAQWPRCRPWRIEGFEGWDLGCSRRTVWPTTTQTPAHLDFLLVKCCSV